MLAAYIHLESGLHKSYGGGENVKKLYYNLRSFLIW